MSEEKELNLKTLVKVSQKVEEQGELITLVLTQIDVQNEKLTKHEKLIENLLTQIENIKSQSCQKCSSASSTAVAADWTSAKENDNNSGLSVAEMVKQTAEETMAKSGFVYDEASGLYLDYASGYYYDPVQGLYYNGHTGTYYTYDAEAQKYIYHSQAVVPNKKSKTKRTSRPKNQNEGILTKVKCEKVEDTKKKKEKLKPKATEKIDSSEITTQDDKEIKVKVEAVEKQIPSKEDKSIRVKDEQDIEEGELSSSVGSPSSDHQYESDCSTITSNEIESEDNASENEFPPCIRAVILESEVPELKKGNLFIVTCTGGSIGKEGLQHSILIPDSNLEQNHCDITYNPDEDSSKYFITDGGSQIGTFLDGKRLSEPNEKSEPHQILHGSKLRIGNTSLLLHIHPGSLTCGHCEPGLLIEKEPQNQGLVGNQKSKEAARKSEMKKMRKKYGLGSVIPDKLSQLPESYKDRAEQRRVVRGSDNPFEKTEVASVDQALKESNKGFKMMAKMGWKEGASLGNTGEGGIKEPIKLEHKSDRRGLGSTNFSLPLPSSSSGTSLTAAVADESIGAGKGNVQAKPGSGNSRSKSRAQILDKTFKRFKECCDDDPK